jgi:hypothetical protein
MEILYVNKWPEHAVNTAANGFSVTAEQGTVILHYSILVRAALGLKLSLNGSLAWTDYLTAVTTRPQSRFACFASFLGQLGTGACLTSLSVTAGLPGGLQDCLVPPSYHHYPAFDSLVYESRDSLISGDQLGPQPLSLPNNVKSAVLNISPVNRCRRAEASEQKEFTQKLRRTKRADSEEGKTPRLFIGVSQHC